MKRKLLFVAALVVSALGFNANAQEDVTSQYLKNADLKSLDDWDYGDPMAQGKPTNDSNNKNGIYYYQQWKTDGAVPVIEFYHTWSDKAAGQPIGTRQDFHFTQTTALPEGYYRIVVNAFYREGQLSAGTNDNKAWIFAGEKKQNVIPLPKGEEELKNKYPGNGIQNAASAFANGEYKNEFTFEVKSEDGGDVDIELGFKGYIDTYNSWCILGPVQLWKYDLSSFIDEYNEYAKTAKELLGKKMNNEVEAELRTAIVEKLPNNPDDIQEKTIALRGAIEKANASISNYEEIKAILDKANTLTEEGQAEYNKTIKELKEGYDAGTIEAATSEQKTKAAEVYNELVKQYPAANADMTVFITNPQINGADGWTTEKPNNGNGPLVPNTNDSFEYWAETATPYPVWSGRFNYYQKLTELPKGVYTIGADMYNSIDNVATAKVGGECGLYGATATAEVFVPVIEEGKTLNPYKTGEIAVTDGTLTIGVKNITNMNARWFVADNFKLTYVRALSEDEESKLATTEKQAAVKVATDLLDAPMDKEAKATLQEAIGGETAALWEAINEARTQHMDYNDNQYYIIAIKEYNKSKKYAEEIDKVFNAGEFVLEDAIDLHYDILREELGIGEDIDYTPILLNAEVNRNGLFWNGRTATGQKYTNAPDDTYLDANSGTYNVRQTLKGLPAGKYEVKVATRAAAAIADGNIYVYVNGKNIATKDVNKNGNSGGGLGNGWDWTTCEFTLETESDVLLGIYADLTVKDTWVSVDDWHLTYVSELTGEAEITDAKYTAYVTTFDTDFSRTEGVTAYKVTEATTAGVVLEEIEKVPAGKAVILYSDVDKDTEYTIYQAASAAEIGENLFLPGDGEVAGNGSIYALGGTSKEDVGFYLVKDDVVVPANKGYLVIEGGTLTAKTFIPLGGEGEATGIEAVEAQGNEETVIYNLAGQRVANPTNGIYIVNGKKVLINK